MRFTFVSSLLLDLAALLVGGSAAINADAAPDDERAWVTFAPSGLTRGSDIAGFRNDSDAPSKDFKDCAPDFADADDGRDGTVVGGIDGSAFRSESI